MPNTGSPLQLTFCTTVRPGSRPPIYKLDTRLGQWFIRPRLSLHMGYIDSKQLFYATNADGIYRCHPTATSYHYRVDFDNPTTLPRCAIPTPVRATSNDILWFSSRAYNPFEFQPPTDPVIVSEDKFEEKEGEVVTIVSDCAVEVRNEKAAGAWHMFHGSPNPDRRRAAKKIDHQPQLTHTGMKWRYVIVH